MWFKDSTQAFWMDGANHDKWMSRVKAARAAPFAAGPNPGKHAAEDSCFGQQVWAKRLAGGALAVLLVNVGQPTLAAFDLPISSLAPALGDNTARPSAYAVRDVWAHAALPDVEASAALHFESVLGHDSRFVILTPKGGPPTPTPPAPAPKPKPPAPAPKPTPPAPAPKPTPPGPKPMPPAPPLPGVGNCSALVSGVDLINPHRGVGEHVSQTDNALGCEDQCRGNSSCGAFTWHDVAAGRRYYRQCWFVVHTDPLVAWSHGKTEAGHVSGICDHQPSLLLT